MMGMPTIPGTDHERWVQLRRALAAQPRIRLARLPTEITAAPRLGRILGGIKLYIKRDDRLGVGLGGNKGRQCEFRLGPGVAAGADTLVTGGTLGPNNFACQAAAAARMLGWDVYLVFMGEPLADYGEFLQGNRFLEWLMGVESRFVKVDLEALPAELIRIANSLRAKGKRPYITGPTDHDRGALAYVEFMMELCLQCRALHIEVDHLVLASGGPTAAGLWLAAAYLGLETEIVAVNPGYYGVPGVERDTHAQVSHIARAAANLLGLEVDWEAARVDLCTADEDARNLRTAAHWLRQAASTEGVFLDPVYTTVAMEELARRVAAGRIRPGARVMFLHTGGVPSLFNYSKQIIMALLDKETKGR